MNQPEIFSVSLSARLDFSSPPPLSARVNFSSTQSGPYQPGQISVELAQLEASRSELGSISPGEFQFACYVRLGISPSDFQLQPVADSLRDQQKGDDKGQPQRHDNARIGEHGFLPCFSPIKSKARQQPGQARPRPGSSSQAVSVAEA